MQINHLEYEARKERTENMAAPYLRHMTAWNHYERKHDMADALCFILFYLFKKEKERKEHIRAVERQKNEEESRELMKKIGDRLEYYAFNSQLDINDLNPEPHSVPNSNQIELREPEPVSLVPESITPPPIESFCFASAK
tara:strand:- start:676 stop:1095 length:420 start_codon:yes stop_codon:yes gene_type:complete